MNNLNKEMLELLLEKCLELPQIINSDKPEDVIWRNILIDILSGGCE